MTKRAPAFLKDRIVAQGITFDDVLLVPGRSKVVPRDVDTATHLTAGITLNIPLLSAAMDTVTESALAIALAQEGGIGIIHSRMPLEAQAREVTKVKRSENGVITDPITLTPDDTLAKARQLMEEHNISGFPVVDGDKLAGIITGRDMRFESDLDQPVSKVMTRENLVTAPVGTKLEDASERLRQAKVEKLLIVDKKGRLQGLITRKDIDKLVSFPHATKDDRGRLRVGAAVGVFDYDRVEALIEADVDVIVVDTAHGHSQGVIDTVKALRKKCDIQLVAGNIATYEAARDLIKAGADAVKVGIGPGSICTTRVISGVGVPQITAVAECARATEGTQVRVIADGGIRCSGDITKAIAAGAHAVMLGNLFAGLKESPGDIVLYRGRRFKQYRGMGSQGAMMGGSAGRYSQAHVKQRSKLVPEGVEGRVPYRGELADAVYQLVGGLKAGMGYCGTPTIDQLRTKSRFIQISSATLHENHPHDIQITQEAPNYSGAGGFDEG